jgi:hypothetical protein
MGVELSASPSMVRRVVAMLHPVCFCTIKDGWCVRLNLRREGLGSTVAVTPVVVEAWTPLW